jgi:hypothetical protein
LVLPLKGATENRIVKRHFTPRVSDLLESVPGILSVIRSPVADALVGMIRSGARLEDFRLEHAEELIQFAERRGLIGSSVGDNLLDEVCGAIDAKARRRRKARAAKAARTAPAKAKRVPAKASAQKKSKKQSKPAEKSAKRVKRR